MPRHPENPATTHSDIAKDAKQGRRCLQQVTWVARTKVQSNRATAPSFIVLAVLAIAAADGGSLSDNEESRKVLRQDGIRASYGGGAVDAPRVT